MERKHFSVNAAVCDARHVTEETLQSYGSLTINCSLLLVTPRAKALLNRYPVKLNTSDVLELPEDAEYSAVNGAMRITPDMNPGSKRVLVVNGSVEILPGSEKALEQYLDIFVNGSVTCPESMSGMLGKVKLNGSVTCYPDGAVVLRRNAVIDASFPLRAKNCLYWSARRMIFTDSALDVAALAAKGARFCTREAIVAVSKLEALAPLLDDRTEIRAVPDGTAVVLDDVTLKKHSLKRYGRRLYIIGDVRVEDSDGLEQMEWLYIQGDVQAAKNCLDRLLEIAQITGEVEVIRGGDIRDTVLARISKWLLEREPDGINVVNCAQVMIDPDVPKELLMERLTLRDCACVQCGPEQMDVVAAISRDVASIRCDGEEAQHPDTEQNTANASTYIL